MSILKIIKQDIATYIGLDTIEELTRIEAFQFPFISKHLIREPKLSIIEDRNDVPCKK